MVLKREYILYIEKHTETPFHKYAHTYICIQTNIDGHMQTSCSIKTAGGKKELTKNETVNIWLTVALRDLDLMAKVTGSCAFCQPIFFKVVKSLMKEKADREKQRVERGEFFSGQLSVASRFLH